jgi:hypothetical protein
MVDMLRSLSIPIRISIGDRTKRFHSTGLDGSLYFGDYKALIGDAEPKQQVLRHTQASFNLMHITAMVDELTIQYPRDVPGISGILRAAQRPTPAETALMRREMIGWRRFWMRYASHFKNLKKLTINVPNDIYADWAQSDLPNLLSHSSWDVLDADEHSANTSFSGHSYPFESPYGKRFVRKVFFRLSDEALLLLPRHLELSDAQRDDVEIPDHMVQDRPHREHRFWPKEQVKRRSVEDEKEEDAGVKRRKVDMDAATAASLHYFSRTLAELGEL